jgi:hypothetical protein
MEKCEWWQRKKIMRIVISLARDKIEDDIVFGEYTTHGKGEKCLKKF